MCGSAELVACLLGWCYGAFFAQERQAQASSSQAPGGMFDAGKDVSCRVPLCYHSATCERGGDGHPGGLL